jgi:hypothetical protein
LPGVKPENIFSTDSLISDDLVEYNKFFEDMKSKNDWSPLSEKHKQLQDMVEKAMQDERTPIVVDNMHIEAWQAKGVVGAALRNGYRVEFVDIGTGGKTVEELASRNRHGVDRDALQKMVDKYNQEGPLTIEKVMGKKDENL